MRGQKFSEFKKEQYAKERMLGQRGTFSVRISNLTARAERAENALDVALKSNADNIRSIENVLLAMESTAKVSPHWTESDYKLLELFVQAVRNALVAKK